MKLSELRPAKGATKRHRRIGRGVSAGQGKSSGRGNKGQHARQGGTKGPYFEGGQLPLVRRLPFKRGFTNIFKIYYQGVNLGVIAELFKTGIEINPALLKDARLIQDAEKPVVIMGDGDVRGAMTIHAHRFTKSAKSKIEAAGGKCVVIPLTLTGARATVKLLRKEQIAKLKAQKSG
jgi:large subunit ribosomal protein L15